MENVIAKPRQFAQTRASTNLIEDLQVKIWIRNSRKNCSFRAARYNPIRLGSTWLGMAWIWTTSMAQITCHLQTIISFTKIGWRLAQNDFHFGAWAGIFLSYFLFFCVAFGNVIPEFTTLRWLRIHIVPPVVTMPWLKWMKITQMSEIAFYISSGEIPS